MGEIDRFFVEFQVEALCILLNWTAHRIVHNVVVWTDEADRRTRIRLLKILEEYANLGGIIQCPEEN